MSVSIKESLLEISAELSELTAFAQGARGIVAEGLSAGQQDAHSAGAEVTSKDELAAAVLDYLQRGGLVARLQELAAALAIKD